MLCSRAARPLGAGLRAAPLRNTRLFSNLSCRKNPIALRSSLASQSLNRPILSSATAVASSTLLASLRFQSNTTHKVNDAELFRDVPDVGTGQDLFQRLTESSTKVIPPEIGYLKEAGLDFGWGPTSTIQWLVEHLLVWGDLPWWAALVGASLLFRIALIRPAMITSDQQARLQAARPAMDIINKTFEKNKKLHGDTKAMVVRMAELKELKKHSKMDFKMMIIPLVVQMAMGFGAFRFARNLVDIPHLGLTNGGLLWITDLTVPDPLYILPLSMAVTTYIFGRQAFAANSVNKPETEFQNTVHNTQKYMLFVLPVLTGSIMMIQPVAVSLPMFCISLFMSVQQLAFRNEAFRKRFNMMPQYKSTSNANPLKQLFPDRGPSAEEKKVEAAKQTAQELGQHKQAYSRQSGFARGVEKLNKSRQTRSKAADTFQDKF